MAKSFTRRFIICVIIFVGISNRVFSQFSDSVNYYLKYAATGTYNKTNDGRSYIFNNGVSFTMNKKKATLNSSNSWIYGKSNTNLTNNDFSSALNFDLLKNLQRLYYWGLATYTTSYSLKINHQFQGGVGVGYNIFNRKDLELVVSNGILYETNNLELAPQVRDKYNTFRNSLRVKFHITIKDLIVLDTWDYWQPSLGNFDDYIIRSSSTLTFKLRKWLGITTSLNYNRLSRTNRDNLLLNFGLTAETYF